MIGRKLSIEATFIFPILPIVGGDTVDVLELEPAVVEASRYFAYLNGDALNDERTTVYLDDGRTTLTYRDEVYDVITSDALSPLAAGAANLYTTDYFRLVSNRLADDGIFSQWVETFIPSEKTFKGILASIREVFPHVVIFKWGPDVVLLGAKRPIVLPWEELVERMSVESVRRSCELLGA